MGPVLRHGDLPSPRSCRRACRSTEATTNSRRPSGSPFAGLLPAEEGGTLRGSTARSSVSRETRPRAPGVRAPRRRAVRPRPARCGSGQYGQRLAGGDRFRVVTSSSRSPNPRRRGAVRRDATSASGSTGTRGPLARPEGRRPTDDLGSTRHGRCATGQEASGPLLVHRFSADALARIRQLPLTAAPVPELVIPAGRPTSRATTAEARGRGVCTAHDGRDRGSGAPLAGSWRGWHRAVNEHHGP
jgi:hypothetical protein